MLLNSVIEKGGEETKSERGGRGREGKLIVELFTLADGCDCGEMNEPEDGND